MQTFAVAMIAWKPDGRSELRLHVVEAVNRDAAEGRAMAAVVAEGWSIHGMLSHSCDLQTAP